MLLTSLEDVRELIVGLGYIKDGKEPMSRFWCPRLFGLSAAVIALSVDWWLKIQAREFIPDFGGEIEVTPYISLVLVKNTGISFGLLATEGGTVQPLVWITSLGLAVVTIWAFLSTNALEATAYGLIVGGGLGNTLDRVLFGGVTDFIYVSSGSIAFPVFNGADVFITSGAFGILFISIRNLYSSHSTVN